MSIVAAWTITPMGFGVWHFGILCSNSYWNKEVIHFHAPHSGSRRTIMSTTYRVFKGSAPVVYDVRVENPFPRQEIIKRAKTKLRTGDYNLISNNCETFANWCATGKAQSVQVDSLMLGGGLGILTGSPAGMLFTLGVPMITQSLMPCSNNWSVRKEGPIFLQILVFLAIFAVVAVLLFRVLHDIAGFTMPWSVVGSGASIILILPMFPSNV